MLQRDYLMRQIQQLTQVLQRVLFQKQQGQVEEAHRIIQQAIGELDPREEGTLRHRSLHEVVRFCRRDDAFRPDFAMRIADILNEEGELLTAQGRPREAQKSYMRALLLYRRAMREEDAAVPLDVGTTLEQLSSNLPEERLGDVEALLRELSNETE